MGQFKRLNTDIGFVWVNPDHVVAIHESDDDSVCGVILNTDLGRYELLTVNHPANDIALAFDEPVNMKLLAPS